MKWGSEEERVPLTKLGSWEENPVWEEFQSKQVDMKTKNSEENICLVPYLLKLTKRKQEIKKSSEKHSWWLSYCLVIRSKFIFWICTLWLVFYISSNLNNFKLVIIILRLFSGFVLKSVEH